VGKDYNNPRKPVSAEKEATVNGERRFFPPESTLLDVVHALHLEPERVAIELNRAIVKRDRWSTTKFEGGSGIEIVQFVGGG
jgi:sulfur carrier protein